MRILKTREYRRWFTKLPDERTRQRIDKRIARIQALGRLVGDYKNVGDGITELRFDFGPGYRIYLGRFGKTAVLLLLGGNKSGQNRDIERAKTLWTKWKDSYVR